MQTAINDSTKQRIGDYYQFLIALKDCFEMKSGQTLQIETNGDVTVLNGKSGCFQKEIKHHLNEKNLSDRDIDFWKTLANWYAEYERIASFSKLILYTTSSINQNSPFYDWNNIDKFEKLKRLEKIGSINKTNEKTFRKEYNRIFNNNYNEIHLLEILDKFIIESSKATIDGISKEFTDYIAYIPNNNRDFFISYLHGRLVRKVLDYPYNWEITKEEFDEMVQVATKKWVDPDTIEMPCDYARVSLPQDEKVKHELKTFVSAIRDIDHDEMIPKAISDYWKTNCTINKYFKDNPMYLDDIELYQDNLKERLEYEKSAIKYDVEGKNDDEKIKIAKRFYDTTMAKKADDFASIKHNQDFFQRGIIHIIVDEKGFKWRID